MAMKLSDLTNHAGEWLRGSGPMSEVVISSREGGSVFAKAHWEIKLQNAER